MIGKLLGLEGVKTGELAADAIETTLAAATHSVGLDYKGIQQVVEKLPPGRAFGVLMFNRPVLICFLGGGRPRNNQSITIRTDSHIRQGSYVG